MKNVIRFCMFVGAAALSPVSSVYSQVSAPAPNSGATTGETIELNPFEVTAGSDQGYAARETLSGTRFKSDLKDVPSQVSVMTREFLDDIASVTLEDAYRYSANIENMTEFTSATNAGADFNVGVLNTRNIGRIRGLTSPGVTHDFFPTNVMQDTYNLERISISSGPNAILFGNGNPGGIVNTSFIRASVQRPKYGLSIRADNHGSLRAAVDLNEPIIKDVLALRLAAVKARTNDWRAPGGRSDDRYFGTITYNPTKTTTLRAYYEDATIDQTVPRNVRFGDQVTPWIQAGRPAFNNGLTDPTVINASNSGIFARNTSVKPILILGAAAAKPYVVWGSAANKAITSPTTAYSGVTIGPGSQPNQVGVDSYIYSLPADEDISPFDVSVNGNGSRTLTMGRIYGASWEQRLPGGLFFQIDYNREKMDQPIADFLRGIQSAVQVDPNLYLPDRVTPNPNFGRYYVESNGARVFSFRSQNEDARAMLSYELDLTKHQGWTKWLGRHQMAAMYLRAESIGGQQETVPRVIPAGTDPATVLDNWAGPLYNTFSYRAYLSDPTDRSTGGTYSLTVPFDQLRTTTFGLPDGSTYVAGYQNPYGGTGAANMVNNLAESRMFAMQNFFLKDRLVTSFGWRHDGIKQAQRTLVRKTAATNAAFESIWDFDPPTNWSSSSSGDTSTLGAVLHVLPWASVFYNQSSTWNPTTALINPDDGTQVPGSTGDGKDYGVMFSLFDNRLSLRIDKYENTSGPDSNNTYRNAIVPVVQNIEQTLIDRTADGTVSVQPAQFYDAEQGTYTLSGLQGDLQSEGYEFELVANPTPNWRLMLNGAKANSTASNIGRNWINFVKQRAGIWAANSTLTGPGSDTTTISSRYLNIIQVLNQMSEADGQRVESGRDWRANFVTRYAFSAGPLKGAFVGGGYQWRSPQVIGYLAAMVDNEFQLPGAPAQVLVPSRAAPIDGKAVTSTEIFFGYSRKLRNRLDWRIQLNIRNVFDNQDPVAQRSNISTGLTTVYNIPEPRSYILTSTFSF